MKQWILMIAFCGTVTLMAGPGTVVVKGVTMLWDDVARVALKVAGKECTDDAVKASAKVLADASGKYGDDVAEVAMRGGIEVAEGSLKHGKPFVELLRRNSGKMTSSILRQTALHADEMVKLSAQYGDDVIRLNEKLPGQTARLLSAIEKSGTTKAGALQMANALPTSELSRVTKCLESSVDGATRKALLNAVQKGGAKFLDKLFSMNAKQIMAGGVTTALIVVASSAGATIEDTTAIIRATANSSEEANKLAMEILKAPNATPDQRAAAMSILEANQQRVKESTLNLNLLAGCSLVVLALLGGFFIWQKGKAPDESKKVKKMSLLQWLKNLFKKPKQELAIQSESPTLEENEEYEK